MANIKITNLYAVGFELFKDSESFMNELVVNELGAINGGIRTPSPTPNSPLCHPLLVDPLFSPLCYPTLHSPYCAPLPSRPAPTLPPKL